MFYIQIEKSGVGLTHKLILSSQKPDPHKMILWQPRPSARGGATGQGGECRAPSGLALSTEVEVLSQNIIGLAAACLVELSTNFREVSQCPTTRAFFLLIVPTGLSFMIFADKCPNRTSS